jgi:hypothetical protein
MLPILSRGGSTNYWVMVKFQGDNLELNLVREKNRDRTARPGTLASTRLGVHLAARPCRHMAVCLDWPPSVQMEARERGMLHE